MGHVDAVANVTGQDERMNASIPDEFLNTGILQFGYFVSDGKVSPVRFCPEYLPAYPALLDSVGKYAVSKISNTTIDHLIVGAESLPLGLVSSLQTGLSLVYCRGRGEAPVYDLVGSYNSGHQCAWLINYLEADLEAEKFISNARSVGLEIRVIVTLLEMQPLKRPISIAIQPIFRLADLVQKYVGVGRLSSGQAQAVSDWIEAAQVTR